MRPETLNISPVAFTVGLWESVGVCLCIKRGVVVELGLINKAGARSGCQSD